jgi:hypothetical protein
MPDEIIEQTEQNNEENQPKVDAEPKPKADGKDDGIENKEDKKEELLDDKEGEEFKVDKETYALISLLQNPQTRSSVIAALAQDVGLQVTAGKTEKAVIKSVTDELKEALGDEWAFLGAKIGPLLEKRLEKERETFQSEFQKQTQKQVEADSEKATTEFFKDNPEAKKFEQRMVKLMDKFPPSEKVQPYEYLEAIYAIAVNSGKGRMATKLAEKAQERVEKNSKDAKVEGLSNDSQIKQGSKAMSLKEAVQAAAKEHGFIK